LNLKVFSSRLYIKAINSIVLTIFAIDYVVRLMISENKANFFRENILDLIAIVLDVYSNDGNIF